MIKTSGLKTVNAYFERSGIRYGDKLQHTPFLVFKETDEGTEVKIVDNIVDLVKCPAKSKVMAQWKGKKKSNFFQFTVGKLRQHIKDNPRHTTQKI